MFSRIIPRYRELKWLAYHDSLTGLKNRNWLHQNMDAIKCAYVYFIDLNQLHEINKLGHTAGDRHICSVIQGIKPLADVAMVRYAGDEFIVFSNQDALLVTNRLYAVGQGIMCGNLLNAINAADRAMMAEKAKPICLLAYPRTIAS